MRGLVFRKVGLGLQKDTPESRPIHPPDAGRIIAIPEVGGLHHRYERRAANRRVCGLGRRLWIAALAIDSRSPVCSEIPATISKTGSAKPTLRPPLAGARTSQLSSEPRDFFSRHVCLILTRTSFAAECIQIEFARTTVEFRGCSCPESSEFAAASSLLQLGRATTKSYRGYDFLLGNYDSPPYFSARRPAEPESAFIVSRQPKREYWIYVKMESSHIAKVRVCHH